MSTAAERMVSWRRAANWAKQRDVTLRVADRLGRGRGRMRILDHLHAPPAAKFRPDLSGWAEAELAAAWLGHATVLLRVGGKTVLTDPALGPKVGLGLGLMTGGPRRFIAPALSWRQLPPLDLILLSHAHFDHLDRPTLARLPKRVPVITAHHTRDLVADLGFARVSELRWGESLTLDGLTVTARAARHWGARTFLDQHRGFNGYLLEGGGRRVLYGGDTAYHDYFRDLRPIDLAILGIGAYDPYIASHATPEQALAMAEHCRAEHVLPMHHSTFCLSHEPINEPIERILTAAGADQGRIVIREVGQQWSAA